ncbi:FAD/NAD-P-binding domain-containing protein [Mytilinidion resinicola]|uniref:FAD/NAD-P-binding domain-containing protein n=1 Tax=Mytilinidion resinicola TaxID=574789 RepID=A0A6A6YV06_9PEZI|nr:FAD/NAD-P-binding domain-containing protein [Mytilinidion resinicola]KAF2812378.1 FAD/NAD-P-binding domain-containing protein [Mytilinidion resinicola]
MGSISDADVSWADRPNVYGWQTTNENGYTLQERPSGTKRHVKIICVGAGASGINFSKFAQDDLQNVETVIYEKNDEVSGTWIENVYPGCACDIPSVTYQYTWEPKIWSKYYSEAPEILEYFKFVVEKYNLRKYIKLRHEIQHAEWHEDRAKWVVKVKNLEDGTTIEDESDILLNCSGIFNYWEWPKIKGIKDFKGALAHSAHYPVGLELEGKRVAVIGTGASGIQLVANIQKKASKLYTWVRSPTWITPGFASSYAGPKGQNVEYTPEQKKRFAEDPVYYLKYRKAIEQELTNWNALHKNHPITNLSGELALKQMREKLHDRPDLLKAITPITFPVGCKRPTPGNGYLEALVSPNVTAFCGASLSELTSKGFIDPDGNEVEVDVIILATGFNTSWVSRFPIIANGHNLQDIYTKRPLSYLGVAAPYMPNYFTLYGPYGPVGQSSLLPTMEFLSRYIIQVINKMQLEDIKTITPKQNVIEQYGEHADLTMKRLVWDTPCRSWMKGGTIDGKPMTFAGSRTQYFELVSTPRYEDYEITYHGKNMWAWLGNGFSLRDVDGRDNTWYWGQVDGLDEETDYAEDLKDMRFVKAPTEAPTLPGP